MARVIDTFDEQARRREEMWIAEHRGDDSFVGGGYAPGRYLCDCHRCNQLFIGAKRSVTCAPCAKTAVAERPAEEEAMPL